jgi:two-component system cell cycle response regulator
VAAGHFHRGSAADTLFAASALLLGLASFAPVRPGLAPQAGPRRLPVPVSCGLLATGVLVSGWGGGLAHALCAATLVVVVARMAVALELVDRSRREALTDGLTGLGNRRRLLLDLGARLEAGGKPCTLALFDLDGFKHYNDAFGHLSGDALLALLADRLVAAVATGRAYRMGGDEFCALVEGNGAAAAATVVAARAALRESGDGFAVTASGGTVTLPAEARNVRDALVKADARMYAEKALRRRDRDMAGAALAGLLGSGQPVTDDTERIVVELATRVAGRLGLADADVVTVARAVALHDVGKMAMPEAILAKSGPLDADEWRLMRQHTIVGERILRAAPALSSAAPLVRSSHERWDGCGYPDGLAGHSIPLGARIVAVCDAFAAMRSSRPHRPARSPAEALAELERQAGAQFDPAVVAAFRAAVREGAAA